MTEDYYAAMVRKAWGDETAARGAYVQAVAARMRAQLAERFADEIADLEKVDGSDGGDAVIGRLIGMKDALAIVLASGLYTEVDVP